jgi:hypothetical protein
MIVEDVDIEIKKFKMFAEKADSESKIIDLCKKYLKHKGIDTDAPLVNHFKPQEPQKIYVGMKDIVSVHGQYTVDGCDMSALQTGEKMIYARKYVVDQITHQLILDDLILFDTYKDMPTYQTIVQGKLNVWKEPRK